MDNFGGVKSDKSSSELGFLNVWSYLFYITYVVCAYNVRSLKFEYLIKNVHLNSKHKYQIFT